MAKKEVVIIADYSSEHPISIDELCEICNITTEVLRHYIEYDIVHPSGTTPDQWQFNVMELQRIKKAIRLQHDLEINLAGIAVVLNLLDQLDELEKKMSLLERYHGK